MHNETVSQDQSGSAGQQNDLFQGKKATNFLQGLHDFIQLLRPQFQNFEGSGCHHYTEEFSRKKRRKVRLDSERESEDTSLASSSRFEVDSYLPIIDQILSSMKIRIKAYDGLQKNFRF